MTELSPAHDRAAALPAMPTWKWFAIVILGWQLGLLFLVFLARAEIWEDSARLWPLAATWELGGLAALVIHRVLPRSAELESGFRLYLVSIVTGIIAHGAYHALNWEDWTSAVRLLLLGPLAGGGAAAASGMVTSILLEYGFKKTVRGFVTASYTSKTTLAKMDATREHIWRVVEVRFGVNRSELPADLAAAINEAEDLDSLSQWFEAALTSATVEAFREAVCSPPPGGAAER